MSTVDPDIKVFMGGPARGISWKKVIGNLVIILAFTFVYGFWINAQEGQNVGEQFANGLYHATVGWLGATKPTTWYGKLMHALHGFVVLMFNFCYV